MFHFDEFINLPHLAGWPVILSEDPTLFRSFNVLREKWAEVPVSELVRGVTTDLLNRDDAAILERWQHCRDDSGEGPAFSTRGWYRMLYEGSLKGKKILDVGCGIAPDTVRFAELGAEVWFIDIVSSNLEVVRKVCQIKGLTNVHFHYINDLSSFDSLPDDFDFLFAVGSLINAPFAVTRIEVQALLKHLPVGGRWIELAYPKERWIKEGSLPFTQWGERTDGGAPWVEWKDLNKLNALLSPAEFEVVLAINFHNDEFNWFDLVRRK